MIAVDTNLLVYAHRLDAPLHVRAVEVLTPLIEGKLGDWALPWPCVHEFLGAVTRPLWSRPATMRDACGFVESLMEAPSLTMIGETRRHWTVLRSAVDHVVGPKVHDARIAGLCIEHGVRELWTADRDFSYFPALATRNPLVP